MLKDDVKRALEAFGEGMARSVAASHLSGLRVVYFPDEPVAATSAVEAIAIEESPPEASAEVLNAVDAVTE